MDGARGLFLPPEHSVTTTQSTSLHPAPLAPPAPAMAEHDGKASRKSAKDGAWDKGVNDKDLAGSIEAKYGGKDGREGGKDGAQDKGVDAHDHNRRTDGATPDDLVTMATTSEDTQNKQCLVCGNGSVQLPRCSACKSV